MGWQATSQTLGCDGANLGVGELSLRRQELWRERRRGTASPTRARARERQPAEAVAPSSGADEAAQSRRLATANPVALDPATARFVTYRRNPRSPRVRYETRPTRVPGPTAME